jgi:NAD+ synthase
MRRLEILNTSLLKIDGERAVEIIRIYLNDLLRQHSARGFLMGLSGGIDSAVLATLAAGATASAAVHAAYIFDRDNENESVTNARRVAEKLGIKLQETNFEPILNQMGIYASSPMQIARGSRTINRLLHWVCRLVLGEHPFMTSLRIGSGELNENDFRSGFFKLTCQNVEAAFNLRHQQRRIILERQASENNLLLLGAANRTEWLTGWFVKEGIDDLPIQPLKGLYKTQIRQLASCLEVPENIIRQSPSPDMMRGITDEYAIGIRYHQLDLALDYLEGGIPDQDIKKMGITMKMIERVQEMKRLSSWKRTPTDEHIPVDGGPTSALRLWQTGQCVNPNIIARI